MTTGFAFLGYAAIYDLFKREVPDIISYGLVASVIGIQLMTALLTGAWTPFLWSLGIGALFFVVGMILFYTGHEFFHDHIYWCILWDGLYTDSFLYLS